MEVRLYQNVWSDEFVLIKLHNTIGDISVKFEHLLLRCENYNGVVYPIPLEPLINDTRKKYNDYYDFHKMCINDKIKEYIRYGFIGNQKNGS